MKSAKITAIISFVIGASAGAAGSWYFLKSVYEQRLQEETESIRASYRVQKTEESVHEDEDDGEYEQLDITQCATIIKNEGYKTDYNAVSKNEIIENVKDDSGLTTLISTNDKPYVISPDEYGEISDYATESLTHYSDGVLTDMHDNIIDDVDEIVGSDYAEHFGEYEDDSVHIRNDAKKCDYEILADERCWSDVLETKPYLKED